MAMGSAQRKRRVSAAFLLFLLAQAAGPQTDDSPLAKAMTLYFQGSFTEAFTLLSDNAVGAGEQMKLEIADRLVMIGLSEYFSKNYKNAYESFRAAVKLSPTNSTALRYFVRMRGEMDVTTLQNVDVAATEGTAASGGQETRPEEQGVGGPSDALPAQAAEAPSGIVDPELERLLLQIRTNQEKLGALLANGKEEGDRRQILSLLDEIARTQNEVAENASDLAQRQEIIPLLTKLNERIERTGGFTALWIPLAVATALGSLFMAFLALLLIRARVGKAGHRGTAARVRMEGAERYSGEFDATTYRLNAGRGAPAVTASGQARGHIDAAMLQRIVEELRSALHGRDHSAITAKLSREIAKELGLSVEEQNGIFAAALAHDAGYLMLDSQELKRIIRDGAQREEEDEFLKSHVALGPGYFGAVELPNSLRDALLYHHEREDGSGYPGGLSGDAIPRVAKIIGVCETFVTLLGDQDAGKRSTMAQAVAAIKDGAGVTYDPSIVTALTRIVDRIHVTHAPS
jgi:HD-GYP domain-containing protein (c-di-GMP phosphodiesterase class II)